MPHPRRIPLPLILVVALLVNSGVCPAEPPAAPRVLFVPASIPKSVPAGTAVKATGAETTGAETTGADATDDLNRFLATVPDGTTVRFPAGARYRIEGTVLIEGKADLVIDGNGSVFQATTPGEDRSKQEDYAGWKETRNRAHFRVRGGRRITLRGIEVRGAHPDAGAAGTFDADREAQHGFDLAGVEGCTLDGVTVHDVFGDCVYMANVREVTVINSTLTRCGRQGIAVGSGERILIQNNRIGDSRRGLIDVEPYGKEWQASDIRIIGNRFGASRLLALPMGGGGTIGAVFLADNVATGPNGTPTILNVGTPGRPRGPFVAVNNRFAIGGSSAAGLRVRHNAGVFLAGNELTFPENRKMVALDLEGSSGAVVGNAFPGAAAVFEGNPSIVGLANETQAGAASRPQAEWKAVEGGFAVRVELADGEGEVVALMRCESGTTASPASVAGYGRSTTAAFAWFHIRDGRVVSSGVQE